MSYPQYGPQAQYYYQQGNIEKYDLPSPLFDFDENSNKYSDSKYAKVINAVIAKIVSKSDNKKVFNSIEYGFTAIQTYINEVKFYFQSKSKIKLTYDSLIALFQKRYTVERKSKNNPGEPIKRKFGVIFNPFYFIMIYQILKNEKFNILPHDDDTINDVNNSDLNFDVDRPTQSSSSGMYGTQSVYPGQQTSAFTTNGWKVITNLLEMLYGKYNNKDPKSITFMTSVLKYLYALFLETVQITQSIDDGSLLPDCAIDITTLDNKNFFRKVFQVCDSQSQMRGGSSRVLRKKINPCKTADESTSTITKMLNKKQNIICELIKFTLIKINKVDNELSLQDGNKQSSKQKKISNEILINALAKSIIYDPKSGSDDTYNNNEIDSYYIDNVPFYKKLLKLYLISAKDILSHLKTNLSSKKNSFNSKNSKDKIKIGEFNGLIRRIENSEKTLINMSI